MSFDGSSSGFRHLSAADFSAEQVAGWCAAGHGQGRPEAEGVVAEWVVAYTDPRREADVARELKRRTFDTYVPAMTVTRRRKDKPQPLLPRYVFVGFREGLNFLDLDQTPGLEGVVRVGAQPAKVKPELVSALREQEQAGVYDFTDARMAQAEAEARCGARVLKLSRLKQGCKVLIVSGPWKGFSGEFDRVLDVERVAVMMKLFGREQIVPMMLDDVEPVVLRK